MGQLSWKLVCASLALVLAAVGSPQAQTRVGDSHAHKVTLSAVFILEEKEAVYLEFEGQSSSEDTWGFIFSGELMSKLA